jgi:hypothetical protein
MTTTSHRYRSEFARRYFDQGEASGEARGMAKSVLTVLEDRGIDVPEAKRNEILQCSDIPTLGGWLHRALTAGTIADLDGASSPEIGQP